MKTKATTSKKLLLSSIIALATPFALPQAARAADHGDGPTASIDQSADIGDVYFFKDPTDATKVVIIGTCRGFIVPSEAGNFGIFDPTLRYRFEIENNGNAKADKFIDVTFGKRLAPTAAQTATIKVSGIRGTFSAPATNPSLANTAPAQVVTPLGTSNISFFAGVADDPFFFDIVGFNRLVASILAGAPDTSTLSRARDSFAGYNTLAIALSVPIATLQADGDEPSTALGVNFVTQRRTVETPGKNGEPISNGAYRNVDRTGNPAVNVALVPFAQKNRYNAGTTVDDKNGKFADGIVGTITALVSGLGRSTEDVEAVIATLAGVAVAKGDFLRLDTAAPTAFPNGRALTDDVIDTYLTIIAGGPVGDGVNGNDLPFGMTFPYVAPSQQPRANGVVDDNTRN